MFLHKGSRLISEWIPLHAPEIHFSFGVFEKSVPRSLLDESLFYKFRVNLLKHRNQSCAGFSSVQLFRRL
jgi:hypothetical protein